MFILKNQNVRTSSTSVEQARERSYHRALLLSKDKDTGEQLLVSTFHSTSCISMTLRIMPIPKYCQKKTAKLGGTMIYSSKNGAEKTERCQRIKFHAATVDSIMTFSLQTDFYYPFCPSPSQKTQRQKAETRWHRATAPPPVSRRPPLTR